MDNIIADIAMILIGVTLLVALGLAVYSAVHTGRMNRHNKVENGVPMRVIALGMIALVIVVAVITLLFADVVDMLLVVTAVLLILAMLLVAYGQLRQVKRSRCTGK